MRNIRFSSFLKPQLRIDTIPKPVGLGSGGPLNQLDVQLMSCIRPASVPVLSSFCPATVRGLER